MWICSSSGFDSERLGELKVCNGRMVGPLVFHLPFIDFGAGVDSKVWFV